MPIYTYRCAAGHEWDEVRRVEGSEVSEEPCQTCVEGLVTSGELPQEGDAAKFFGRRVPARFNASFKGSGWTPTFYPGRKGNK